MAFSVTKAVRAERRKRAEERQVAYDKLTLQEKLAKLPANGAKKQRAKLEAAIQAEAEKAATKKGSK